MAALFYCRTDFVLALFFVLADDLLAGNPEHVIRTESEMAKRKFCGSIETLEAAVASLGAVGTWAKRDNPRMYTYRSHDGEIVNWWPRTRTLQFQGRQSPEFQDGVIGALGTTVRQGELQL